MGFVFWSISMMSTSIVWLVLAYMFGTDHETRETERGSTPIKEESDDESADPAGFPSSRRDQPAEDSETEDESEVDVKQEPSPATSEAGGDYATAEHAGMGTGLESVEARGVQRR